MKNGKLRAQKTRGKNYVPRDWKLSFFVVYLKVKEVFTVYRLKILRDQEEMNEYTKMKASAATDEDVKFDKY